jgi:hypothetical protein
LGLPFLVIASHSPLFAGHDEGAENWACIAWLRPYSTIPDRATQRVYGASDYAVTFFNSLIASRVATPSAVRNRSLVGTCTRLTISNNRASRPCHDLDDYGLPEDAFHLSTGILMPSTMRHT